MSALFADRADAGRRLAVRLTALLDPAGHPLVLALPRGGVPVAVPIAAACGAELDVLVARKIGAPRQPEFGVGAIAEDGPPVVNPAALRLLGLDPTDLADGVAREQLELGRRVATYRGGRPLPPVAGRRVVLVDDGLATGITSLAAVRWVREGWPLSIVVAAPVCSGTALGMLQPEVDAVVSLAFPVDFTAVGAFYDDFDQVSDADVVSLLASNPSSG